MNVNAYENWLTLDRQLKPSTVKNHIGVINYLVRNNINFTSYPEFQDYLTDLHKKSLSSSHINNLINCARVYSQYCKAKNFNFDEKLLKLKFVKDKYRPRATMSDEEIELFLSFPREKNTGFYKYQYWRLFFNILAFTGMRPGETAKLKVSDVDFGRQVFVLEDTKTNENRFVPIPDNIFPILKAWIDEEKQGFLFKSHRPEGHTSSVEWHYNFHIRLKKLGLDRPNLTPYSLRHSLITRMIEEDINIFKIQKIVGHNDLRTTLGYTHLTTKDIVNTIKKDRLVRKYTDVKNILKFIESFIDGLELTDDPRFEVMKESSSNELKITIRGEELNQASRSCRTTPTAV